MYSNPAKATPQVLINQSAVMPSKGTMMIGMSTGIYILFFFLEEIKQQRVQTLNLDKTLVLIVMKA